jgi:nicotinamide phosphoribosyltransferase
MSIQYFAPIQKDAYKVPHPPMYLAEIESTHSNYTNRFGKYSNVAGNKEVMLLGLQPFMLSVLIQDWNKTFFDVDKETAVAEYSRIVNSVTGTEVDVEHMNELHDLGFLPLEIRAVEEGVTVPYGVPSLTVDSTVDGFGWCSNMIETVLSSEISGICTSATTALAFRTRFELEPSLKASGMIKYMGHDFSYRGMLGGTNHAAMSGTGHAASFMGSDTLPVIQFIEKWYGDRCDESPIITSVAATEHSVACSFILCVQHELETTGKWQDKSVKDYEAMFKVKDVDIKLLCEIIYMHHLMTVVVPTGILSLVCDSFDFWAIVEYALPVLKPWIVARDGVVVVRPDSGDPVDVLCGHKVLDLQASNVTGTYRELAAQGHTAIRTYGTTYQLDAKGNMVGELAEVEAKGLIQMLGEIFGTTDTEFGLKALESHIGAIYGDSITLERQDQIIEKLKAKGLVPQPVLGIGSFTYQYVTRDTHGSAVKATAVGYKGGNVAVCKDPKTDPNKKSAKGILMVVKNAEGKLELRSDVTVEEQQSDLNELKVVFRNSKMVRTTTFKEIRARIDARFA